MVLSSFFYLGPQETSWVSFTWRRVNAPYLQFIKKRIYSSAFDRARIWGLLVCRQARFIFKLSPTEQFNAPEWVFVCLIQELVAKRDFHICYYPKNQYFTNIECFQFSFYYLNQMALKHFVQNARGRLKFLFSLLYFSCLLKLLILSVHCRLFLFPFQCFSFLVLSFECVRMTK